MLSAIRFYLQTRFMLDEEGQGMVEYGLILALIAIVVIGVLSTMGTNLGDLFQEIADKVAERPAS